MGTIPIYVWNHLPSADNKDGLVARSEQPVLPEVIEERRILFRRLQDQDAYFLERIVRLCRIFKAVYCPSSARHIESANLICELLKLPTPIPDARLNNVDYGEFKGQPSLIMKPRHEYVEIQYPGGDSWRDCLDRWRSFFEEILPPYEGQPVMLLGQTGAAIRMCAHLCEGMNLSEAVDLEFTDPNVPWVYFYKC
jgi:broad specificity phosphatase PhoE